MNSVKKEVNIARGTEINLHYV